MTLVHGQKFKTYEYKAYPKYVQLKDGSSRIVNNLNEHEALHGQLKTDAPAQVISPDNPKPATVEITPVQQITTVTDKTALYEALDLAGAIYDKRWNAAKLQETLDEALKAITPFPETETPPTE